MRRRRGFTLNELLIALALLVVLMEVGGQLFSQTFNACWNTQRADNESATIDSAISRLRGDVWNSLSVAADGKSARLILGDGRGVSWRIDAEGSVTREDGGSQTRWAVGREDWRFSGDAVSLTITDEETNGPRSVRLGSQVLLFQRRTP